MKAINRLSAGSDGPCPLGRTMRRLLALALLLPAIGCGGDGQTTSVRGAITFKGAPVPRGVINFNQPGSRPTGGPIQPDGTYEVELAPGEYQVLIDGPPEVPAGYQPGDKLGPRALPDNYASFEKSGLKATVTGDSPLELDFKLP